jgi:hypothetical protein
MAMQPKERKRAKRRPNFRPTEGFHWHETDERYRGADQLRRDFVTLLMVHQACVVWLRRKGLLFEDAFRERQDYKNKWRRERRAELKEAA